MKTLWILALSFAATLPALRAASLSDITVKDIDGKSVKLESYRGKVILIVNVASECGFTPQYEGLQALYEKYRAKGFVILGFPCNQFGGQEPGSNAEIKQFCTSTFHVTFPLFDKIEVNGPRRDPLYALLVDKFPGDITWNFNKFLVGRDGSILKRFDSPVEPNSKELVQALDAALADK